MKKDKSENGCVVYTRQQNDEVVQFEGVTYCVKTPWLPVEGAKSLTAYAVAEGAETCDGMFPSVKVEAFSEGGKWEVIGVFGPELEDESGGGYGTLLWSEATGFVNLGEMNA